MRAAPLVLAAVALLVAPAAARPLVVLIGDSTSWGATTGTSTPVVVATTQPARTLKALLRLLGPTSFWYHARVANFGVPGSRTPHWVTALGARACLPDEMRLSPRLLHAACAAGRPLAHAVLPALGRRPDAVLVTLGANDVLGHVEPDTTVANLEQLGAILGPDHVFVAPPLPAAVEPFQSGVRAIRERLVGRKLVTGPDWPALPTADGLHLTEGGYAAVAGLWLDVLRRNRR